MLFVFEMQVQHSLDYSWLALAFYSHKTKDYKYKKGVLIWEKNILFKRQAFFVTSNARQVNIFRV